MKTKILLDFLFALNIVNNVLTVGAVVEISPNIITVTSNDATTPTAEINDEPLIDYGSVNNKRPLKQGDTLTAEELLPIAEKLREKAENLGNGQGIVSGSRRAEALADKLFHNIFFSSTRIVRLRDFDISFLDALQALAFSDKAPQNDTSSPERYNNITRRSQGNDIRVSRYKLLSKSLSNGEQENINQGPVLKDIKDSKRAGCTWRFKCINMIELDTCRLSEECPGDKIERRQFSNEEMRLAAAVEKFRSQVGISMIDEDLEKILEIRMIHFKKKDEDPLKHPILDPSESIGEYLDNVMRLQDRAFAFETRTTPYAILDQNELSDHTEPMDMKSFMKEVNKYVPGSSWPQDQPHMVDTAKQSNGSLPLAPTPDSSRSFPS